ncbi:hypothetical protein MAPG_10971, partial [Magnaporthiopsis poae ATCC 64411]
MKRKTAAQFIRQSQLSSGACAAAPWPATPEIARRDGQIKIARRIQGGQSQPPSRHAIIVYAADGRLIQQFGTFQSSLGCLHSPNSNSGALDLGTLERSRVVSGDSKAGKLNNQASIKENKNRIEMSSDKATRRLDAIARQLAASDDDALPPIKMIAGDSASPRVKDKVVIITGANSPLGIGRAAAHQFAANGARAVYLCDYDDS